MRKYAYIKNGRVNQFLYTNSKDFPNIPLSKMFQEEIVKNCVEVSLEDNIKEGMDYNSETGEFTEHIEPLVEESVEEVEGNETENVEESGFEEIREEEGN